MTSLDKCKDVALQLFDAIPIEPHQSEFGSILLEPHVFVENKFYLYQGNIVDITKDKAAKTDCINRYKSMIRDAKSVDDIYFLVRNPYKMTFLKYIKPYIDNTTFSELLHETWIEVENENKDINVEKTEIIEWFKTADKTALMRREDYVYYKKLPQTVTIYRGVSERGTYDGLSWTVSKDKAEWFQYRFMDDTNRTNAVTHLLTVMIDKYDILAYFNDRDEKEVVVDIDAIRDKIKEIKD